MGLNAEILAIAVDDLSRADLAAKARGYPFPVLYDVDTEVSRAYEVYNRAGYANPAVFIVDSNGSLVWTQKETVSHRTPNRDIIAQLEKLN